MITEAQINQFQYQDTAERVNELALKSSRTEQKITNLRNKELKKKLITSSNHHINLGKSSEQILCVDERNFEELEDEYSVVILLNSNIGNIGLNKFITKVESLTKVLLVVHDLDNHHWHLMSYYSLIYSDIYVPAHPCYYSWYEKLSEFIISGFPCGSINYEVSYINENTNLIDKRRQLGPFGPHFHYEQFKFRNEVLSTLNKNFPDVYLRIRNSLNPDDLHDSLKKWSEYKTHWIVPVGGDLPFRAFDALCTGGIPILPKTCMAYLDKLEIDSSLYTLYSVQDISDPMQKVIEAAEKFDSSLPSERALNFAQKFSYSAIVQRLFDEVFDIINQPR